MIELEKIKIKVDRSIRDKYFGEPHHKSFSTIPQVIESIPVINKMNLDEINSIQQVKCPLKGTFKVKENGVIKGMLYLPTKYSGYYIGSQINLRKIDSFNTKLQSIERQATDIQETPVSKVDKPSKTPKYSENITYHFQDDNRINLPIRKLAVTPYTDKQSINRVKVVEYIEIEQFNLLIYDITHQEEKQQT